MSVWTNDKPTKPGLYSHYWGKHYWLMVYYRKGILRALLFDDSGVIENIPLNELACGGKFSSEPIPRPEEAIPLLTRIP